MNIPQAHAYVFKLSASTPFKTYPHTGVEAHAAFFNALTAIDPKLSTRLHDGNTRKPYTISPLVGDHPELRQGDTAYLRIVLLNDLLSERVIDYFLHKCDSINIRETPFIITTIYATPNGHPRAGTFTPDLESQANVATVSFNTATVFKWRKNGSHHT